MNRMRSCLLAAFILCTLFGEAQTTAKLQDSAALTMPRPPETDIFKTGELFPLFNIWDIDGQELNLRKEKGKIIVMNFWFVNCGPCRREIPELNLIVDSFKKDTNVLFIAIALDKKEQILEYLEKQPFKYRIIDDGGIIAGPHNVTIYPTHLIIDQEGKVYFHSRGLAPTTMYWLKRSINELLEKG
jgi:thiol-disulfide isomerase/thioredoxin